MPKKYNHGEEAFVILRDHHEPIIDRTTFELRPRGNFGGSRSARQKIHNGCSSFVIVSPVKKSNAAVVAPYYVARFKLRK